MQRKVWWAFCLMKRWCVHKSHHQRIVMKLPCHITSELSHHRTWSIILSVSDKKDLHVHPWWSSCPASKVWFWLLCPDVCFKLWAIFGMIPKDLWKLHLPNVNILATPLSRSQMKICSHCIYCGMHFSVSNTKWCQGQMMCCIMPFVDDTVVCRCELVIDAMWDLSAIELVKYDPDTSFSLVYNGPICETRANKSEII